MVAQAHVTLLPIRSIHRTYGVRLCYRDDYGTPDDVSFQIICSISLNKLWSYIQLTPFHLLQCPYHRKVRYFRFSRICAHPLLDDYAVTVPQRTVMRNNLALCIFRTQRI